MKLTQMVLALGLACFAGCGQREEAPTMHLQQEKAAVMHLQQEKAAVTESAEVSSPKCTKAGETQYINRELSHMLGPISSYASTDEDCCSVRYDMISYGSKIAICSEIKPKGMDSINNEKAYLVLVSPLFKEGEQVKVESIGNKMYNRNGIPRDYTPEPAIPLYELVSLIQDKAPTD